MGTKFAVLTPLKGGPCRWVTGDRKLIREYADELPEIHVVRYVDRTTWLRESEKESPSRKPEE